MRQITGLLAVAVVALSALAASAQDQEAAKAGEKVFRKCAACHTALEAKNKVGPHLVGIIDRKVASVDDYSYSKAMTSHAETVPVWTEEALAEFLRNPRGTVKGTKMAFAGLKKDEDMANLIVYLKNPAAAE